MNKTTWAWILIGLGVADIIGWFGIGYGWTNVFFGVNAVTRYGWSVLIAIGILLLRLGHAEQSAIAEEELEDKHLPSDEKVIHRQPGTYSVLTLTNRNLRFRGHSFMNSLRTSTKDIPASDSVIWPLSALTAVHVALTADALNNPSASRFNAVLSQFLPTQWTELGIRLTLKDGTAVNVPCGSPQLMAKYLQKQLQCSPAITSPTLPPSATA